MGRRNRRGRVLHGVLLLDKPAGGSSNHALQRVKRLFDAQKAGHTGSLDPLATGMLPICFGEATKLSAFLLDADKGYEASLKLGVTTSSADADGEVLQTRAVSENLDIQRFTEICSRFRGPQNQVPPMVSAIRINGQRLYKLAREGTEVDRPARAITIHELKVLEFAGVSARLLVHCSKGTYIRSLVSDIGEALGCGAHVTALRRTFVSPFVQHPMIGIPALEALSLEQDNSALDELLLPLDAGLLHLPRVTINDQGAAAFRQGQAAMAVDVTVGARQQMPAGSDPHLACRVYSEAGLLVGLGQLNDSGELVSPRRVIQWG